MLEEWRRLVVCNETLFVSNYGNVISDSFTVTPINNSRPYVVKSIWRKQYVGNHGYYSFRFKNVLFLTHRLVAQAFIPNLENKPEVNHLDGNKTNNVVTNLEWVTCSENMQHAWDTNLRKVTENRAMGESQHLSKLNSSAVFEILSNMDKHCSYFAEKFKVSVVTINDVQTGKKWKHLFPELPRKIAEGGKRRLSDDDIRQIRSSNLSRRKLSKIYGISVSSIRDILKYITYKEVV